MATAPAPHLAAPVAPMLRVAAAWGTTILGVKLLPRGQSALLGDGPFAVAPMPDGLQAPQTPLPRSAKAPRFSCLRAVAIT